METDLVDSKKRERERETLVVKKTSLFQSSLNSLEPNSRSYCGEMMAKTFTERSTIN